MKKFLLVMVAAFASMVAVGFVAKSVDCGCKEKCKCQPCRCLHPK